MDSSTATAFTCKCGQTEAWIHANETLSLPCPKCGRLYKGVYDKRMHTIRAKEIKHSVFERCITVETGVAHTQTKSCKLCIHIGTIAIYLGKPRKSGKHGFYIKLFAPK